MYPGLLHIHSLLRWAALILLVATVVDSLYRMYKPFNEKDRKLALFTLISLHLQLVLGLILYFISPVVQGAIEAGKIMSEPVSRFWVVEHLAGMLLAIILVTIGYSRAKRQSEKWAKHRIIFYYYLFALILILVSIPWPFREAGMGRGWLF